MKKTNENGITLIALVVTIVVLLILAGITITYVMADGGIFDSAKTAASQTITSQIADYASQVQATFMTQMAVKTATGITPTDTDTDLTSDISVAKIQNFFPSTMDGEKKLYEVKEGTTLPKADTDDDDTLTGDVKVVYKDITYKVEWTKGIVKVTVVEES